MNDIETTTEYEVTIRFSVPDYAGYVNPSLWDWQALVDCVDTVTVVRCEEVGGDA